MGIIGRPKLCKNGCNSTIVWYLDDATGEKYFVEMDANGAVTGQRHRCPNYLRPESTATTVSTSTTEDALKPSNVDAAQHIMIQILQIVQRIERILSDTTTPQQT